MPRKISYRNKSEKAGACCYICCVCCCFLILIGVTVPVVLLLLKKDVQFEFVEHIPSTDNTIEYTDDNNAFNTKAGFLRFNVISRVNIKTKVSIDAKAYFPSYDGPYRGYHYYEDNYFGTGSSDIHLKSKSNATVDVPFSITYTKHKDQYLTNLKYMIDTCKAGKPLKFYIVTGFGQKASFIQVSGSTFESWVDINWDCPFKNGELPPIPGFNITTTGNSTTTSNSTTKI